MMENILLELTTFITNLSFFFYQGFVMGLGIMSALDWDLEAFQKQEEENTNE